MLVLHFRGSHFQPTNNHAIHLLRSCIAAGSCLLNMLCLALCIGIQHRACVGENELPIGFKADGPDPALQACWREEFSRLHE